ncbi:hypothetical protein B0A52_09882 [Exophiala mesophila]|uniref:Oxidoreductase NAD-binding domain-containing protein 1 n=1 Tax=Exophiala mesophila TaxID=212818 RepID=A0A438MSV6_EXOME|nr:hypothetical protein B0A52_09882 [Exophiala mesophila]
MATVKDSIPHIIRTADDPRQNGIWSARLSRIEQINSRIRLLRLSLPKEGPSLRHLPGQYIDLYIPNIDVVGGFTITSAPQDSNQSQEDPHIELAIQSSPDNPPAAYLWRPISQILDSTVSFKVGGTFVYPPLTLSRQKCEKIDRAVFIAGGVGINPIMSMISAIDEVGVKQAVGSMPKKVRVLYSARRGYTPQGEKEDVLFEHRLEEIARKWNKHPQVDYKYRFFQTGLSGGPTTGSKRSASPFDNPNPDNMTTHNGRITHDDLFDAIGPERSRRNTVIYVCGLPTMTDEFVYLFEGCPGLDENRVLCEKWW